MALGATVYNFDIDLADSDRGVYETLALRVARHPSESDEYPVARVLAYRAEYKEGIAFSSGGLSDPDEPPIAIRDLTGASEAIGSMSGRRTPLACTAPPSSGRALRSTCHKDPAQWLRTLAGRTDPPRRCDRAGP